MIFDNKTIRFFDIIFSLIGLFFFSIIFLIILCICFFKNDKVFFFQERVGIDLKPFTLIKFKTMISGTINEATHLVDASNVTNFGKFLRKSKLDELPQLINVLKGEMSIVGPRPCLYNQTDLLKQRLKFEIYKVKPGITGLAQIKKIDMSDPILLVNTESIMIKNYNLYFYFKYILLTICGYGLGDKIKS